MRTRRALGVVGLALATACGGSIDGGSRQVATEAGPSALTLPPQASPVAQDRVRSVPVCAGPSRLEDARCHSRVVVDENGAPRATPSVPAGFGPADLWSAYSLPAGQGTSWTWNGQTIAIVDAYDNPSAEADLGVYRAQFGLPPCTTANGCFRKVNQTGGTRLPRANQGWALEIALDVQMASAVCPSCRILLVEASSNSLANLGAAVSQAATMGANAISNSYGAGEFSGEASYESPYNHPGVAVTVSSGDAGYGVEFPAASRYVVAVGGTTLARSTASRGWSESAWSGAGSGCSAYIPQPTWQSSLGLGGCSGRMVADVSAVADPATGVAVYDSYGYQGQKGWFVVGGTSASAPIVAAVYGVAGNAATAAASYASFPYSNTAGLFDVVSGSNGSCGGSYLCTAVSGYDGPTGLGSPDGIAAF